MTHRQIVLGMVLLAGLAGLMGLCQADPLVRTVLLEERPTAVAVTSRLGRAFITTIATYGVGAGWRAAPAPGHVRMFDTASGTLLGTVTVGRQPLALAVDERMGRVFVVTALDGVSMLDAHRGRLLRTVAVGRHPLALAVVAYAGPTTPAK